MPDIVPSLDDAASPFLRHGATQPVDWMPWGPEAFERAGRENRPVLLDIGAVWCHWCHVMDRESYEDPETAELINTLFVPVKVDRDERPDVDARYQRAVQALSGQGGWPLTAFLTPEGEAFYAGTYFPPTDAHGRPAFRRVLAEIARIWKEQPARAQETAAQLRGRLEQLESGTTEAGEVRAELVDAGEEALASAFDFRHGGFGGAPKFPSAGALMLLLERWLGDGIDWKLRIVRETLEGMGRGGMYDQLGGGFHRYSVDARWLVPHFEKMAYDNGPLLEVYARAWAATGEPFFREVAEGIIAHYADVAPDLVGAGGFPASQDADVGPDDDGAYWTWTQQEMREALGDDVELVRAAVLRYGMQDPAGALHSDPSRHVLWLARSVEDVAERIQLPPEQARRRLEEIARRLKETRDGRPRPYVDTSLYSGWVALVASGFLAAGRWLAREDAAEAALRALERIWSEAWRPGTGVLHRVERPEGEPLLEDQAYVAQAFLDAFELTQDAAWLERAEALADVLVARFRDDAGAFQDRPAGADAGIATLARPHRPITDSPTPAPNAVAALVLLRLEALTGDAARGEAARAALAAFAGSAAQYGTAMTTYLRAVDRATGERTTVVIVGEAGEDGADALLAAALASPRPRTTVRRFAPGEAEGAALPPELAAMLSGEAPRAYVCVGKSCAPPTADPDALAALLRRGGE